MKIYNRQKGQFIDYWNADDKVDAKGKPCQPLTKYVLQGGVESPDLPAGLAAKLLKDWPRKFTADAKAAEAEVERSRKLHEQAGRIADLENYITRVQALFRVAGDKKGDKKAALEAAKELDTLLSQRPGIQPPAAPPAVPVPVSPTPPEVKNEAPVQPTVPTGDFESRA